MNRSVQFVLPGNNIWRINIIEGDQYYSELNQNHPTSVTTAVVKSSTFYIDEMVIRWFTVHCLIYPLIGWLEMDE